MDYSQLQSREYFACKIKCTYAEIYVFSPKENKYYRVFSLQKKDFNGVLGYGEKTNPNANNLVPITLTEQAIMAILNKVYPAGTGMGVLQSNLSKDSTTELHRVDNTITVNNGLLADANIIRPTPNTNPDPIIESEQYYENETVYDPLTKIDDGVVYVNYKAIDCDVLNDEDVGVEEIVEEDKKDYSKLIWIALAAAATALL